MTNPLKTIAAKVLEDELSQLTEVLEIDISNQELLQERLAELELALEDSGWMRLGGDSNKEFSREGLRKINALARLAWLKNPLIKRAVYTQTTYVFGQGGSISAPHPLVNQVVQAFLSDPKNRAELTEHQTRMVKETELQIFGNLFFVFFVNQSTGQVRIRTIPMDEIGDIIYNPEDGKEPWYYRRDWTETKLSDSGVMRQARRTAYYPDFRNTRNHPPTIDKITVQDETPIYHVAVNRLSDMKFGVSEVYAAIDWSKAYKNFLEDWSTIVRAYSKFAWNLTTKGGSRGVAAAKSKLKSTVSLSGGTSETNPQPIAGSTFIGGEGVKMEPIKTSGATTGADDSRRLMLMVCSATGIFEHYLTGDPSTGNLATAKSMERPMELMFRDRQELWRSIFNEILQFVIDQNAMATLGDLTGEEVEDDAGDRTVVLANDTGNEDPELWNSPIDRTVNVTFPPLLEHDIAPLVAAIIDAATLAGKAPAGNMDPKYVTRLLLRALGEDEGLVDEITPEEVEGPGSDAAAQEALMLRTLQEISSALDALLEETVK